MIRYGAIIMVVVTMVATVTASDASAAAAVRIPACPSIVTLNHFNLTRPPGTIPALQSTSVSLCWTNTSLKAVYSAIDNNIQSPYSKCNEPLFNSDVVEMFIGAYSDEQPLKHYFEFEVSPKGVLFACRVKNPNGVCNGISDDLIDCASSGITYEAHIMTGGWQATLQLPWSLLESSHESSREINPVTMSSAAAPHNRRWLANFFRIDVPQGHAKEYSCWQSTHTDPPCFHVPSKFGSFELV